MLAIEYHVLYLTGVATAQVLFQDQKFAYGEITERSFSNPHPWTHSMA